MNWRRSIFGAVWALSPLAAGCFLILFVGGSLQMRAVASEPLRVTIEKTNGESTPAYLEKASERAILWKYTPEAATGNTMAREEIKSIEFEPPDEWSEATQLFDNGAFSDAATAFGAIADKYKDIMLLKGNPASMAKYLEVESHRLVGDLDKLTEVLNEETLGILKVSLHEQYHPQLELDNAWAAATRGNWDVVNQLLAEKSLPKEPGSTRTPEFKKETPPRQAAQLAYLRGLSFDAAGDKGAALAEFYRSLTLGYGNNRLLSGKAVLQALAILTADDKMEEDDEKLKEVRSLAMTYKLDFGSGSIPEQYSEYAVPLPEAVIEATPPPAPPAEESPKETPAAEGAGKAAPADGAPADGAKAEDGSKKSAE